VTPDRAAQLLRSVAALRGAVTYQRFLDSTKQDEHPYHLDAPLGCLRQAAALAEQEHER